MAYYGIVILATFMILYKRITCRPEGLEWQQQAPVLQDNAKRAGAWPPRARSCWQRYRTPWPWEGAQCGSLHHNTQWLKYWNLLFVWFWYVFSMNNKSNIDINGFILHKKFHNENELWNFSTNNSNSKICQIKLIMISIWEVISRKLDSRKNWRKMQRFELQSNMFYSAIMLAKVNSKDVYNL